MITISEKGSVFTVVIRLSFDPDVCETIVANTREMMPLFAQQPGFISMSVHRSHDQSQLLSYLQWRSRADHEACQEAPELAESGGPVMELLTAGKLEMEVKTYDVLASTQAD